MFASCRPSASKCRILFADKSATNTSPFFDYHLIRDYSMVDVGLINAPIICKTKRL
jgi:hypothetical protein